jgi:hypothetical protein
LMVPRTHNTSEMYSILPAPTRPSRPEESRGSPGARKDGPSFFCPIHQTIVWQYRREEDDGPKGGERRGGSLEGIYPTWERKAAAGKQAGVDSPPRNDERLHLGLANEHAEKRSRLMLEIDHTEERGEPEHGPNDVPRKDARVSGARGILPRVRKVGPARPGEARA